MLAERFAEGQTEDERIRAILTTGAAVANTGAAAPAGGTGAAAGGWDTGANRDLAITSMNSTRTQLNALLAELRTRKIIAP